MDEIRLMERLGGVEVPKVCQAVIDVASKFCLEYCSRNDCPHVLSNIWIAADLRNSSEGWVVEDLVQHPSQFGDMRYLLSQVIKSRGLKPIWGSPYNPKVEPIEFRQYATADKLVKNFL